MGTKHQALIIHSENGGKGDIWMRLAAFYAAVKLTDIHVAIHVPASLQLIAGEVFGDRLVIMNDTKAMAGYTFTSLGLRHLLKPIQKGKRFILPYALQVYRQKKNKKLKDRINYVLLSAFHLFGFIRLTKKDTQGHYQGYAEITAIKAFSNISYKDFVQQLQQDYACIAAKLGKVQPSGNLIIPENLYSHVAVFPTGTGRQFVPVWWAKKYLPGAYYAFYAGDTMKPQYEAAGLKTIEYYAPNDIVVLSAKAGWTVSTDSFPSHLLQYFSERSTLTLTEAASSQVIAPVYKGKLVPSMAPCHPCLHLDRTNHPVCQAGFTECLNWKNSQYTNYIIQSLPV